MSVSPSSMKYLLRPDTKRIYIAIPCCALSAFKCCSVPLQNLGRVVGVVHLNELFRLGKFCNPSLCVPRVVSESIYQRCLGHLKACVFFIFSVFMGFCSGLAVFSEGACVVCIVAEILL